MVSPDIQRFFAHWDREPADGGARPPGAPTTPVSELDSRRPRKGGPTSRLIESRGIAWLTCLLIFGSFADSLLADPNAPFEEANRLYEQGQYTNAVAAYENLLATGQTSPALHFNLANAWLRAGQIGRAIRHYRLAQDLAPRDPDIRANLHFARGAVYGATGNRVSRWQQWIHRLTLNEWTLTLSAGIWSTCLLLVLHRFLTASRKPLRVLIILCLLGSAVAGAAVFDRWNDTRGNRTAIVVVPEATVRYGPLEESRLFFYARDGLELPVHDTQGDWLQVSDAARRIGWIQRRDVVLYP